MPTYMLMTSCVLMAVLLAPFGVQPSGVLDAAPTVAPLSERELENSWGGLFGSRIGQNNGGILELSCGDEDLWPASLPQPWLAQGGGVSSPFGDCGSGRPHFLPRYEDPNDVRIGVSAAYSGTIGLGSELQIFVNDAPIGGGAPFATVACELRKDWDRGTARPAPGSEFGLLELEARECPESQPFVDFEIVSLSGVDLHEGLNTVTAVVKTGSHQRNQDQETRFFCIGTDECLTPRVRLRPIADGDVNSFIALPIGTPRWQTVSDYPDPIIPGCPPPGGSFVSSFGGSQSKTQLFEVGGNVPPGVTFSSCTIRTKMSMDPIEGIGTCPIAPGIEPTWILVNNGGSQSEGPQIQPRVELNEYERFLPVNPFTGVAWTSGDLAGLQIGVRRHNPGSSRSINVYDMVMDCAF